MCIDISILCVHLCSCVQEWLMSPATVAMAHSTWGNPMHQTNSSAGKAGNSAPKLTNRSIWHGNEMKGNSQESRCWTCSSKRFFKEDLGFFVGSNRVTFSQTWFGGKFTWDIRRVKKKTPDFVKAFGLPFWITTRGMPQVFGCLSLVYPPVIIYGKGKFPI